MTTSTPPGSPISGSGTTNPVDDKWSLSERPGCLRLHSLPAPDFWNARNTLTQRAIGPESSPTAELDTAGLKPGDIAGLALLSYPYAWIGVSRNSAGFELQQFDQTTGKTISAPFAGGHVWLRAHCDFMTEKATFGYSTDGKTFQPLGGEFTMIFQVRTFQGVRYALFNYNVGGAPGGYADFNRFTVGRTPAFRFYPSNPVRSHHRSEKPLRRYGRSRQKWGSRRRTRRRSARQYNPAQFKVEDRKLGPHLTPVYCRWSRDYCDRSRRIGPRFAKLSPPGDDSQAFHGPNASRRPAASFCSQPPAPAYQAG